MITEILSKIFDVVVDLRQNSSTFLRWHGEYLSSQNINMMVIPEGIAHGFQVIEKEYFNCKKSELGRTIYFLEFAQYFLGYRLRQ